jgi:alkylation response protein AidB-like acyl-CoA dehydrogenase
LDRKFSEEAKKLRKDVLKIAATLGKNIEKDDEASCFPKEDWDKCAEFGIIALPFPEEYGGLGSSMTEVAVALEALGEGCPDRGLIFSICAHLCACCIPLWKFGSESLKSELLTQMICGKLIGANAMTESESGSDAFSLKTKAEKVKDGYVINGSKIYCTNAPVSDVVICYAKTSPKLGYLGITAFAIPRQTEGLTVGHEFKKIGLRTSPMGAVYLENCFVPEKYRIGNEGNGARIFEISMNWERTFLFAFYVGMMERQFKECLTYAKNRKQFNQPLVSFQALSHKLVEMKLRLEISHLLLYKAVESLELSSSNILDGCLAKLYISEAAVKSGLDAVQIHGGFGTMAEGEIERMLRDSIPATIFSGTSEIMKEKIIKELLRLDEDSE